MRRAVGVVLGLVVLCAGDAWAQARDTDALRNDLEFAKRKVYPALVNIGVVSRFYRGGRVQRGASAGSGAIVGPDGLVVTNYHVAGDGERITCTLPTGEVLDADVVAHDPPLDITVLRMRLATRADRTPLPFATLGNSDDLRVGDYVLAMGNPLSLSSSMTQGIVCNTKRVFTDFTGTEVSDMEIGGEATGMFTRWLQHDALILPGNSGGPLVNLRGEIVGVNTRGGGGVGFATPSNLVGKALHQALAYGEIRRGWLGFGVLPVDKLDRKTGALVSAVLPGSPAGVAGLLPGDILLAIGEQTVECRFFEQVPVTHQQVADLDLGSTVTLRVERQGQSKSLTATVAKMARYTGEEAEFRTLGLTVQAITGPMALARNYPDADGVVVTGVRPGYPFEEAKPKLGDGDVIRSMAGRKVTDLASFRAALEATKDMAETPIEYRRDAELLLSVMQKPPEKPKRRGGELTKAWLGVKTQVCTPELAKALGTPTLKGFRLTLVYPATEAAKAGLQAGDVLTGMDGDPLEASRPQDAQDLRRAVEDSPVNQRAKFAVWRAGKTLELTVILEPTPMPAGEAATALDKDLEFSVRDLVFTDRAERQWTPDRTGVVVTDVTSGGFASMAGLHSGDVIVGLGEAPVTTVASFTTVIEKAKKARPSVVTVFVHRGVRTHFVLVEPDWVALDKSR